MPFVEENILSLLCVLDILVEDINISGLCILVHYCMSVLKSILYSFKYSNSVAHFEIRKYDAYKFAFTSQDHFGYSGYFIVPYKF